MINVIEKGYILEDVRDGSTETFKNLQEFVDHSGLSLNQMQRLINGDTVGFYELVQDVYLEVTE